LGEAEIFTSPAWLLIPVKRRQDSLRSDGGALVRAFWRTSQDRRSVFCEDNALSNLRFQAGKSLSQVNSDRSLALVAVPVIDRKT